MSGAKKLVLVLATSTSMIGTKEENAIVLEKLPCIYYPVQFQKRGKKVTWALIKSSKEFNAMTLAYAKQLARLTNWLDQCGGPKNEWLVPRDIQNSYRWLLSSR